MLSMQSDQFKIAKQMFFLCESFIAVLSYHDWNMEKKKFFFFKFFCIFNFFVIFWQSVFLAHFLAWAENSTNMSQIYTPQTDYLLSISRKVQNEEWNFWTPKNYILIFSRSFGGFTGLKARMYILRDSFPAAFPFLRLDCLYTCFFIWYFLRAFRNFFALRNW